ncbi:MAG: AAA family ATPase [Acidobacteria bacterium]|nr:MAG: AAA family ATPase [Acidobacteriota bacterium]
MSSESEQPAADETATATLERGTYEILRDRLVEHARQLRARAEALNAKRLELFGSTELQLIGNERIRTENNCVPRDVVSIGDHLLFGYNVFIGLKTETRVEDVLALHRFEKKAGGFAFEPLPPGHPDNFLADEGFLRDFRELYQFYKDARLQHLQRKGSRLLAVFQTGAAVHDVKVFRWAVDPQGKATYVDNRGERDYVFPPSHDFEWTPTGRHNFVLGRHPHVSIEDEVFVETVGGDLTIKIENNTEDGLGIYREDVDEPDQSLDDAQIHYARVGSLILLKILPYNEKRWRYLVYNTRTQKVDRIDAIGQACVQLPEDHGLIFPGGYYLQSGESKTFDVDVADMAFKRMVRSPNGEDVLYVFYHRGEGRYILLSYNLIRKKVQAPLYCNGYSLFADGTMVVFRAASDEPTRVHPMQIWQTPFTSDEHAAQAPATGSFLATVGNADLVRGISEALSICRLAEEPEPNMRSYEDLIAACVRTADAFYWLGKDEVGDLLAPLAEIRTTADQIVGEFDKVERARRQTEEAIAAAAGEVDEIVRRIDPRAFTTVDDYVAALAELRRQRGHVISLKELRYADLERLAELESRLVEQQAELTGHTVDFLLGDDALLPYHRALERHEAAIDKTRKLSDARPIAAALDELGEGLELLTEVIGNLEIDDATVRTSILERISEVVGNLNRTRALYEAKRKELLAKEGAAEFGAQFTLFSQNVAGALALADEPEKCDQQLAKLMLQLEELESRFGEIDDRFLEQLATKREDVYEAFSSKKQSLLDARQRRAGRLWAAAERILDGIARRAAGFEDDDELNAYFAGDAMVAKARDVAAELRQLGDSVKADELESRLKAAREDAVRGLRDRRDLFEAGAEVIKLGRHRFSVNVRPLELTMVPRGDGDELHMAFHLTGTDFYQPVADPSFDDTRPYWDQLLVSETAEVYRGEYLAYAMLIAAEEERDGLSIDALRQAALAEGELLERVRAFAAERYDEGYERGLHDHDAALILERLLALYVTAGLLRFAPRPRALACLFWATCTDAMQRVLWERRAQSLARLRTSFAHSPAIHRIAGELAEAIGGFLGDQGVDVHPEDARMAGAYLFEELALSPQRFVTSAEAEALRDAFHKHLEGRRAWRDFEGDLKELKDDLANAYALACAWLQAFLERGGDDARTLAPALEETAVLLLGERNACGLSLERRRSSAQASARVEGLLGQHPRIRQRAIDLRLDEFLARLSTFRQQRVPGFRRFQALRHRLLDEQRRRLRLEEYRPRVMSAFVRNRLIDRVYLPLFGDNLAKQLGALGESKRTDQMGLLLLISPPGYGKTTLMEYVANRLGMVFVKVNGPALGHGVTSLDPAEAPNATARQEVDKINFALELGNNVLLYLDDVQHTHPELLQKFISLCDAQRRMEGVWHGRTRTYDLRGKRFAVCMAGNPYTESGARFKIPDMLANRADVYNLGDVLTGKDELFAMSYLENALTSNPTLAPLASRDSEDLYLLARMARGEEIPPDQLSYDYPAGELEEMLSVLRKLLRVQEVLLEVNRQYIDSAAQEDAYRREPPFQLQGSYRNMNKLAEKIVPVMNDAELEALIDDHYLGEAQTLTSGAEANLLKLKELRGVMSDEERARWEEIKRGFQRLQAMGGAEEDPAVKVVGQLGLISDRLGDVGRVIEEVSRHQGAAGDGDGTAAVAAALDGVVAPYLAQLHELLAGLAAGAGNRAAPEGGDGKVARQVAQQAARLGKRLDAVFERLGEVVEAVAERPLTVETAPVAAPAPAADLTPYLAKLGDAVSALAERPQAEIVQTLSPGVVDVLARLGDRVGENLLPLVQSIGRRLKKLEGKADRGLTEQLDRTLKSLDEMKELVAALKKIDTRALNAKPSRRG